MFIVMTMWENFTVTEKLGWARELELQTKGICYKPAIQEGARMVLNQSQLGSWYPRSLSGVLGKIYRCNMSWSGSGRRCQISPQDFTCTTCSGSKGPFIKGISGSWE